MAIPTEVAVIIIEGCSLSCCGYSLPSDGLAPCLVLSPVATELSWPEQLPTAYSAALSPEPHKGLSLRSLIVVKAAMCLHVR